MAIYKIPIRFVSYIEYGKNGTDMRDISSDDEKAIQDFLATLDDDRPFSYFQNPEADGITQDPNVTEFTENDITGEQDYCVYAYQSKEDYQELCEQFCSTEFLEKNGPDPDDGEDEDL